MGRPLKIQTTNNSVATDVGYPNFGSVTAPVKATGGTLNDTQFYGVVGGASNASTSATFPRVKVRVFVTGGSEADGYIIRQKGSHKYLVGDVTSRTAVVSGLAYRITTVGNTTWSTAGATGVVGEIFTATGAIANTGTGRVNLVGVCVLTSDLTPTAGLMSISYFLDDSTEVAVSKLTNKWVKNWTSFANAAGTSLTTYADGGNNVGVVNYTDEDVYLANFFTDEGTAQKSGADLDTNGAGQGTGTLFSSTGGVQPAIIENSTS